MKSLFLLSLAAVASVIFCGGAAAAGLSLSGDGVVYDTGPAGLYTLTYPVLLDGAEKPKKIMDKSFSGSKAVVKYEGGGQLDLELGNGEFYLKFSGVPKGTKKIHSTMLIASEYNRGGKWIIGGGEAKDFPREKPAKPFLYQGNAKAFELINPSGVRIAVAIPDYSFQQLQDNREWGWNIFQWQFWTPYNPDTDRYAIKIGSAGSSVPAGKSAFIVDRFGQDAREKIVNRLANEDELKKDVEDEKAYYANLKPPTLDRFGGLPESGARLGLKKTGFFHVENKGELWLLVDPDGNAFFHLGICSFSQGNYTYVTGRESTYEWIPPHDEQFKTAWNQEPFWNPSSVSFHIANMIRKYGEPVTIDNFQSRMIDRVRLWGFNSIGAFSGVARDVVTKKNFPYTAGLPSASGWNGIQPLPEIRETFDPFDEKTVAEFEKQCAKSLSANADDPLLIGYFVSNEPTHEAVPRVIPTLKNLPVKRRLVQFLEEKYKTIAAYNQAWNLKSQDFKSLENTGLPVVTREASADMQEFTALFFEAYYKVVYGTFRKYDRNHMLIGNRWQPGTANNEQLCRIAGKYFDIVSVNYYAYGVDKDYLGKIYKWCGGKPMMLSEFYWSSSSDSGLGAFKDVNSQDERGLAYRNYLEQSAALGYVVGIQWFTLVDQPRTGNWFSKYDGERANTGLISVTDRPWKTMLAQMMKSNYDVYKVLFRERKPFAFDDPRFSGSGIGAKQKITIIRTPKPIVIDGERGDWPGIPPEMISGKRLVEGTDVKGFEANFRLCWDDNNLYILADVTDPTPMQNKHTKDMLWSGDGLELFVGSEELGQGGALQFSDRQVLLGAGVADGKEQCWLLNAPAQVECKMAVARKTDGNGYILEAAIPFSALGFKPRKGQELLFDLAVDDSVDGKQRRCQIVWNGTARNSSDRGAWGRAVLGE